MANETKKEEEKAEKTAKIENLKQTIEKKAEKVIGKDSKDVKKEEKIELEREYVVPLRRGFVKTARYKRASRAVRDLKIFLAKHMHVENRDVRDVKIDRYLNEELWYRGIA